MLEELKKHNALVQERIMKSFGYKNTDEFIQKSEDVNALIQKGEIDYDFELEKAVYADTAENRKLGRVGQEYHRGRKKSAITNDASRGGVKKTGEDNQTKNSGVKLYNNFKQYISQGKTGFGFVRDNGKDNPVIRFTGDKKKLNAALKKFNSETNSNLKIDDFEREIRWGLAEWDMEIPNHISDEGNKQMMNKNDNASQQRNKSNKNQTPVDFLTENADKYLDYQYGDIDDETSKKFDEAMKHVKMGKTFDYGEDGADEYKDKMENKGYHVIDLTPGSDQTTYALVKKPKK